MEVEKQCLTDALEQNNILFIPIWCHKQESTAQNIFLSCIPLNRFAGNSSKRVDTGDEHITHLANRWVLCSWPVDQNNKH